MKAIRYALMGALIAGLAGCANATTEAPDDVDAGSDRIAFDTGPGTTCPSAYDSDPCTMSTDKQTCIVDLTTGERTCTTTTTTVTLKFNGYPCVRPLGEAGVDFVSGCTYRSGPTTTITVPICSVCSAP